MGNRVVVSFLIPALNEEQHISDCLASIRQYIPPDISYEIVVGDHGSKDKTASIAQALDARVITRTNGTIGALRNDLATEATGAVLIFVDADIRLTSVWRDHISDVIADILNNPLQVLGASCLPASDTFYSRYWFRPLANREANYVNTGHLITSPAVLELVKGFDVSLSTGEDYAFSMAAKERGVFVARSPNLEVLHLDYPRSLVQFMRREKWHGTGDLASVSAFIKSRVAIMSCGYGLLLLNAIASVLLWSAWAVPLLGFVVLTPLLMSFYKLPELPWKSRAQNTFICGLYLTARCASLMTQLRKRQLGWKEQGQQLAR